MRVLCVILPAALAAGCVATSPAPQTAEAERAAALARLLDSTAQRAPERFRAADAEMRALEQALAAPPPGPAPPPDAAPPALASAPDLSGGRSVLHAVHLASYRRAEHADAGWTALSAELAGRGPDPPGCTGR